MYIINTSFMVEPEVHGNWYDFMVKKFLPHIKSIGYKNIIFTRVLSEHLENHYTYSLQVDLDAIPDYKIYIDEIFAEYISITKPLFASNVLYVNTLMKKITY